MPIRKIKKTASVKQPDAVGYVSYGKMIDISDSDTFCDHDSYRIDFISDKNEQSEFNFEINEFPGCCGLNVVNDLSIRDGFPQNGFNTIMKNMLSAGETITITTNGKGNNIIMEEYLTRCKLFTKVKRFRNPNSSNIITIWVSNNGAL